jgi:hypothetical protein
MTVSARRPRFAIAVLASALAVLGAFLLAAAALAADATVPAGSPAPSLTDNFSAADQYVESVPTARGPKVPGVGKPRGGGEKRADATPTLSPELESSLGRQPGEATAELERIATSSDYGAPAQRLRNVQGKRSPRVPAAAVSAVREGEEDSLSWLLVALIATTLLIAGTAGYRRYRSRNSAG